MKKHSYTIVQDGTKLNSNIEMRFRELFSYRDLRSNSRGNYIDFVGFIISNQESLVSFPKHFFTKKELIRMNQDYQNDELEAYLNLLYKVIQKIISSNCKRLYPVRKELNNSYPFEPFFKIYEYYQLYGLYTQENEVRKFGHQGKIIWKDTIRRSPVIINEGNMLYWPPIVKESRSDYVFVSNCMIHVINTTLNKFPFLNNFMPIHQEYTDISYMNNQRIIFKLNDIKQRVFKDTELGLIDNLINFYSNTNYDGSYLKVKIHSYHLVWEDMVGNYLNKYFIDIDENYDINFSQYDNQSNNFQKRSFDLDSRRGESNTYKIIPDYFLDTKDKRYIFDAKYYVSIDELDYKQLSYLFLLKRYQNINKMKVFSALLLPTAQSKGKKIHFQLDEEYSKVNQKINIIEYYLNVRKLFKLYLTI